jgi:hypothetical protein
MWQVSYYTGPSGDRELASLVGAPTGLIPTFSIDMVISETKNDLLTNYTKDYKNRNLIVGASGIGDYLIVNGIYPDVEEASRRSQEIIDRIIERHRAIFRNNLERAKAATEQRVEELMVSLSAIVEDSQTAGVQTFMLYGELLGHQKVLAGIAQLDLDGKGGVLDPAQLNIPLEVEQASPVTRGLLGLLLGMALVTALVIVRRFFEQRILTIEDLERSELPLRFVEQVKYRDGAFDADDLVKVGAALSAGAVANTLQPLYQMAGIEDSEEFLDLAEGLLGALSSLGTSLELIFLDQSVRDVETFSKTLQGQLDSSKHGLLVATPGSTNESAKATRVGRIADQTLLIAYAGSSTLPSLKRCLDDFRASGINCEGVLLVTP